MSALSHLFSLGFRPFFLAAGFYAALAVGAWSGWLGAFWNLPDIYPTDQLHGHEMLFGFALAAVAGFQLTAVPQWTGATPLRGKGLAVLAGAWLLGRLGILGAGALGPDAGPWVAMVLDLLFPMALWLVIGAMLVAAQNRRNYVFIALLGLVNLANLAWHLEMLGIIEQGGRAAMTLMLNLLLIMIAVIGGRIIPLFSANWMRRQGVELAIRHPAWLQLAAIGGLILLAVLEPAAERLPPGLLGTLALVTGLLHLVRLSCWRGWQTLAHPLVWIMHLGYLWLCLALILKGAGYLTELIPLTAARHAAAVGAVGTMIMAIMPRVSLGHTGRDLILPRPMLPAFTLIAAAAFLRVASPFLDEQAYQLTLLGSGLCWSLAFLIFSLTFAPMLLAPRVD